MLQYAAWCSLMVGSWLCIMAVRILVGLLDLTLFNKYWGGVATQIYMFGMFIPKI